MKTIKLSATLFLVVLISSDVLTNHCLAFGGEPTAESNTKESVRVPAMRNRVYTQLARAQQVADAGDKAGGLAILDEVKDKIDSLNSYEVAMLWNFYGFMHYGNENLDGAINSFENVVAQQAIPSSLRLATLYSLSQLSMQQQNFKQSLAYLEQWQAINSKPLNADQHITFAQIYYQDKQFQQSLTSVKQAIALKEQQGEIAKENWLTLLRANFYELKQPVEVTEVMEQLVKHYPKPEYWLQLAAMYGEIGKEDKQLAVMETAYQAGYIEKSQDILALAQLYRYHQVPYKAAVLLEKAIDSGQVVANERNLESLALAYISAKDDKKAIPVLQQAAKIAETGKFDVMLAQSFLNLEMWQEAIDSADNALERGGIKREGDMHLVLGMSYFNIGNFEQSLIAFNQAQDIASSEKTAKQWYKYVEREQGQQQRLAMLRQ
ncbi:tetratricopeptide repeat protein [Thalassotalea ganghwensis]